MILDDEAREYFQGLLRSIADMDQDDRLRWTSPSYREYVHEICDKAHEALGEPPFAIDGAALCWPKHAGEMALTHNAHKSNYETVAEAIAAEDHGYTDDCWISIEQRVKAIGTNSCWTLQWYPDTPVGFYIQSAADLSELLKAVNNEKR